MAGRLSKKQLLEIGITSVGILMLIFLIPESAKKVKAKRASMNKIQEEVKSYLNVPLPAGIPVSEGENVVTPSDSGSWGRDPFHITGTDDTDSALSGLTLNGIVWDIEEPYAIINNDVFKIGDKLNDFTIVEINEKNVVLEQDGERYTLELKGFE